METSTCTALCTTGQSKIRLDPFALIKDFHVSLSGSEDDWMAAETDAPQGQSELEALEAHD